jgi:hypothetical protein
MARQPVPPCVGDGMIVRRVVLRSPDVVFFKGVVEASEGLAAVFAEKGGELFVAAPAEREGELDALLDELCAELRGERVEEPPSSRVRAQ